MKWSAVRKRNLDLCPYIILLEVGRFLLIDRFLILVSCRYIIQHPVVSAIESHVVLTGRCPVFYQISDPVAIGMLPGIASTIKQSDIVIRIGPVPILIILILAQHRRIVSRIGHFGQDGRCHKSLVSLIRSEEHTSEL